MTQTMIRLKIIPSGTFLRGIFHVLRDRDDKLASQKQEKRQTHIGENLSEIHGQYQRLFYFCSGTDTENTQQSQDNQGKDQAVGHQVLYLREDIQSV